LDLVAFLALLGDRLLGLAAATAARRGASRALVGADLLLHVFLFLGELGLLGEQLGPLGLIGHGGELVVELLLLGLQRRRLLLQLLVERFGLFARLLLGCELRLRLGFLSGDRFVLFLVLVEHV